MRKYNKRELFSGKLFILLLSMLIVSCNFRNPADNLKVIFSFKSTSAIISGQFLDAGTGLPVEETEISLHIQGEGAEYVLDLAGASKTDFTVENGFVTFGIDENVIPTEAAPVALNIIAEAPGYVTSSQPLLIDKDRPFQFTMNMVNIANPPDGVGANASIAGQAGLDGALLNTISLNTTEPISKAGARLSIPAGTVITDRNGSPLTGQLTTTMLFYSNLQDNALAAFPGGFAVTLEKNEVGARESVVFTTAGFVAIEILDSSGRTAKSFSQPAQIEVDVSGQTLNPETGASITTGNILSFWSLDDEKLEWAFEGKGALTTPDAAGNYKLGFQLTHLSYYNLGWAFNFEDGSACRRSRNVILRGISDYTQLNFTLQTQAGRFLRAGAVATNDSIFVLKNVRASTPVVLSFQAFGNEIGRVEINDLCAAGDIPVALQAAPEGRSDVNIKVSAYCKNQPELVLRPTVPIYFRKKGTSTWYYAGLMTDGELTVNDIEIATTYEVKVTYGGKTKMAEYTIQVGQAAYILEFEISDDECPEISG